MRLTIIVGQQRLSAAAYAHTDCLFVSEYAADGPRSAEPIRYNLSSNVILDRRIMAWFLRATLWI